jgi:hypothetical protein
VTDGLVRVAAVEARKEELARLRFRYDVRSGHVKGRGLQLLALPFPCKQASAGTKVAP